MMSPGPRLFASVHSLCCFTVRSHALHALTPELDGFSIKTSGKEQEILGSSSILLILTHTIPELMSTNGNGPGDEMYLFLSGWLNFSLPAEHF